MRKSRREWLFEIKSLLSCIYCRKSHPAIIDFHHRDPDKKYKDISSIHGKRKIMEEIKKCDPICANCHRKLHYGEVLCPTKMLRKEKNTKKNTTKNGMPATESKGSQK